MLIGSACITICINYDIDSRRKSLSTSPKLYPAHFCVSFITTD